MATLGRGIMGATCIGPGVGMRHAATIIAVGEVPLATLWHAVPAFPTLGKIWLRLLDSYRDTYAVVFT